MNKHTPGPWQYDPGGGHACNSIRGAESRQTRGWPERRNGYSNASYSEEVCRDLGDVNLPTPAANVRLILAAPDLLEACREAVGYKPDADCFNGFRGWDEVVGILRTAIATAEGTDCDPQP